MDAKLDKAIGSRLKELRVKAGLSLNELAARSGVSRAMVSIGPPGGNGTIILITRVG